MSKSKYSSEERLQAVNDYLTGQRSAAQICNDMKIVSRQTLYDWVGKFGGHGENWFIEKRGNQRYSAARKEHAVEEYLKGRDSLRSICVKYSISSKTQLLNWIKQYNSDIKLKDYNPKPEVYMAAARRKTTIDERREIVEYCLSHDKDYKGTAEKYDVSYSQVYHAM